jgi:hypothetical protein
MVLAVPGLGYPVLFLASRQGRIALIGLVLLVLVYLAVSAFVNAAEEMGAPPPGVALGAETAGLALAIREYAEHLRSHTKVVQELGGTTQQLREAAESQNEILRLLRQTVGGLAPPSDGGALGPRPPVTTSRGNRASQPMSPETTRVPAVGLPADARGSAFGPSEPPFPEAAPWVDRVRCSAPCRWRLPASSRRLPSPRAGRSPRRGSRSS